MSEYFYVNNDFNWNKFVCIIHVDIKINYFVTKYYDYKEEF